MKTELIFRDDHEMSIHESMLYEMMPIVQDVVDKFNKLGTNVKLTPKILEALASKKRKKINLSTITDFINSLMINSDAVYTTADYIPISKEKLINLIDAPDIKAFMEAFKEAMYGLIGADGNNIAFSSFEIVDNKVQINQKELHRFNLSCTYYAKTEGEVKCAQTIIALCDALNAHHKFFDIGHLDFLTNLPRGVKMHALEYYEPDIEWIERFGEKYR